jgi:tRNA U34 5-carboxymethylaminomethyl modifying enzyme MnmG/GidA
VFGHWRNWPRPQVKLPTNAHRHEYDKRVFRCIHKIKLHKKAFSLGALATQALDSGMEEIFLRLFKQQEELFECHGTYTNERYWDKVRESVAQSTFYGASWQEAATPPCQKSLPPRQQW